MQIARHPEEIEHISRDYRVTQEQRDSAGRKKFVYTPPNKSGGQEQALEERHTRRFQPELKKCKSTAPEQQREGTEPSMNIQ